MPPAIPEIQIHRMPARCRSALLPCLWSVLPLLLPTTGRAQAILQVGPGGLPTIDAALAIAVQGDIVLVAPGSYPAFHATVGVTIRAATPGTVFVAIGSQVNCPGQTACLADLDLRFLTVGGSTCELDGCTVTGISGSNGPCLTALNSQLRLVRSVIGGPGEPPQFAFITQAGIYADATVVSAVDCTIQGRERDLLGYFAAGPGINLVNGSRLHGSNLDLRGGDGATTSYAQPGSALVANASTFWIADSTLRCGRALGVAGTPRIGCPVVGTGGRFARSSFDPVTCPPSVPVTGTMMGIGMGTPMASGAPLQIDFLVEPDEWIGVYASPATADLVLPDFEQPIAIDLNGLFFVGLLIADGSGQATGQWLMPPGFTNTQLWLQGVTTTAWPFQLSAPVGGVIR